MAPEKAMREALQSLKADLLSHFDSRLDQLQGSLRSIETSVASLGERMTFVEQRISTNEDNIISVLDRLKHLEQSNAYLQEKVDDLENRSRSANLRFLRIPEKSEGRDVVGFMQKLITELLGASNFPEPPAIVRAHRSPTSSQPGSKTGPRQILIRLLNPQDKIKILRLAREKGVLSFAGAKVLIFPDYSAALVRKRRLFDPVKKKLRDMDIKYSLKYPATLRVDMNGKTTSFASLEDAEKFVLKLGGSN